MQNNKTFNIIFFGYLYYADVFSYNFGIKLIKYKYINDHPIK